jgi:hypothetical protein
MDVHSVPDIQCKSLAERHFPTRTDAKCTNLVPKNWDLYSRTDCISKSTKDLRHSAHEVAELNSRTLERHAIVYLEAVNRSHKMRSTAEATRL